MAEKKDRAPQTSWSLEGQMLVMKLDGITEKFDLSMIFPQFNKLTFIQQMVVKNGVTQKLGDKTAKKKYERLTIDERVALMKATWEQLVKGEWRTRGVSSKAELDQAKKKAMELVEKGLLSQEAFETLFADK